MLVVFVAVLAATVAMFGVVPKGFIPDQDNDSLNVNLQAAQGTSFYDMVGVRRSGSPTSSSRTRTSTAFLRQHRRRHSASMNRARVQRAADAARASVRCRRSRSRSSSRPQLLRFPGFRAFVSLPAGAADRRLRAGNSSLQPHVQSAEHRRAVHVGAAAGGGDRATLPEMQDVSDDMEMKSPRVNLVIDRDKAAAVGLNATQIENALSDGFGPQWSSTIYGADDAVPRAARARSEVSGARRLAARRSRSRRRAARSCRSSRS